MRPIAWISLIALAVAAFVLPARADAAAPAVRVGADDHTIALVPRTVLVDPDGSLSPAAAAERLVRSDATVETNVFSLGYTSHTLWSRIVLDIAPDAAGPWYLSLELPNFDRLEVFSVSSGGAPAPLTALGDQVEEPTDIRTRFHIAPIDLPAGTTVLLTRGSTGSTMTVDLKLRKLAPLLAEEQDFFALQTFYIGIASVLGLSALGLFLFMRQWIYLIYVANLIAHTAGWLIANGTGPGHLWPELARSVHVDQQVFFAFTLFGTALFARHFLATDRVPALVRLSLTFVVVLGFAVTALRLFVPDSQTYWYGALVSNIVLPNAALLMFITGISLFRGEPAARPLMLTWIGLLAAIVLAVLRNLGLVPNTPLTLTGPQLGSVFEMVVFAYMLVSRLGRLQREKEQVQREALEAARAYEAELEQRVADRTAELDAAVHRERAARRLQQQFVAMISHEFRTPLAIIDGAAQNVRAADAKGSGRIDKIRSAVRRLLRMIDACLVDDRVESGTIHLHREPVDLAEMLRQCVDTMASAAPAHRIDFEAPPESIVVSVDPRLTEISINNLLENATKYSSEGSAVTVTLDASDAGVDLTVSDDGPGVPEAERERIFEKYHRADNTAGTAGAGLGLHLVRSIMEAHGGTVAYAAGDPRGSRFSLRFPTAPQEAE